MLSADPVLIARFDGYDVIDRIGAGGFATIYQLRHPQTGKDLALKVLQEKWCKDKALVQAFTDEAEMMMELDHPSIPRVYACGSICSLPAYSMDLAPSSTVRELVDQGVRYDCMGVWSALVRAVAYLHEQNIIHNDIKLLNVVTDAQQGRFALLDFGNAKRWTPQTGAALIRRIKKSLGIGRTFGTVMYAAPEVIEKSEVSPRSDVYALGVCAYEMFTGTLPWKDLDQQEQMKRIIDGDIPLLKGTFPVGMGALANIIDSCLRTDKDARPENAIVVANRLERFLDAGSEGQRHTSGRLSVKLLHKQNF